MSLLYKMYSPEKSAIIFRGQEFLFFMAEWVFYRYTALKLKTKSEWKNVKAF